MQITTTICMIMQMQVVVAAYMCALVVTCRSHVCHECKGHDITGCTNVEEIVEVLVWRKLCAQCI